MNLHHPKDDAMAARLTRWLARRGHVPDAAPELLTGGRSNLVWRLDAPGGGVVCKLSRPRGSTPLFPNDGVTEARVLAGLAGQGIAPALDVAIVTPEGLCLVYAHLPGDPWSGDPASVARLLRQLHGLPPPPSLRRLGSDPASLRTEGLALLDMAGTDPEGLRQRCPDIALTRPGAPVWLHGDPVPGNIILGPDGPRLIDWQCPATGEALHDLAMFLSPAMQVVNGRAPLNAAATARFLAAYNDPTAAARLAVMRPLLCWRMACYCTWKVAGGDASYSRGLRAELSLLARL